MKFNLKICSLNEAPNIAYGWADRVISIIGTNSTSKPNFSLVVNHYTAVFDDVTSDDDIEKGYIEATYNDIKNILEFTEDIKKYEKVLIHCHTGLSRSPSIAYLVCAQHGLRPGQALMTVKQESQSLAVPNQRIVELGEKILKSENGYSKFLKTWIKENHFDRS